jgi:hypothetical protein
MAYAPRIKYRAVGRDVIQRGDRDAPGTLP